MSSNVFAANVHYAGNVIMSQSLTVATLNVTTSTSTAAATFSATPAADANVLTVIGSSTTGNVVQFSNAAGGTFIMTNAGRIGIGTANPATALDVYTGTMNAATVTATSLVGTMYGVLAGSNTVAASTVTATSLVGTHYGVLAGSNTVAASTVTATSLVGTMYGDLAGSNTVAASTVSATSLVGTMYGALAGSNTVSASAATFSATPAAAANVLTVIGSSTTGNVVQFSNTAGGTFIMTNAGNVGIGTTSPVAPLSTFFATSGIPNTTGSGTSNVATRFQTGSVCLDIGNISNGNMWLQNHLDTNWATNYPILLNPNGGNVGIGTTSPGATLQVSGNIYALNGITVGTGGPTIPNNQGGFIGWNRAGSIVNGALAFLNQQGGGAGGWEFINYNISNQISANCAFLSSAGGLTLGTYSNVYAAPTGGIICPGNVGIGVTNPQVLLAAVGTCTLGNGAGTTTAAYHTGMVNIIGGGTRALLRIENNNSVGSPGIIFGEGGGFTEDTQPTIKKVQGTNNLAIMCGGNVGIGTVSPANALQVAGTAATISVGGTASWSNVVQLGNVSYSQYGSVSAYPANRFTILTSGLPGVNDMSNGNGGLYVASQGLRLTGQRLVWAATSYESAIEIDGGRSPLAAISHGQIRFYTANAQRAVIDESGNVGIGVTNPGYPLHVVLGASGSVAAFVSAGVAGAYSNVDITSYLNTSNVPVCRIAVIDDGLNSGHFTVLTKSPTGVENNVLNERFRIKSNGNVGIGTAANINSPLVVYNPASTSTYTGTTAWGNLHLMPQGTDNSWAGITFGGSGGGTIQQSTQASITVDSNNANGTKMRFNVGYLFANGALERMTIIGETGRVGIGTTSPGYILEVSNTTSSTSTSFLGLTNPYAFGFNTGLNIGSSIVYSSRWQGDGGSGVVEMCKIDGRKENSANYGDSYLAFQTRYETNRSLGGAGTLTEKMRISGIGNVGIGITNPGFPLEVASVVTNNFTASYGFYSGSGFTTGVTGNQSVGAKISGYVWSTNGFLATSDARIKIVNPEPISNCLNAVNQLRVCKYEYIDKITDKSNKLGFIAQEVQKAIPESVTISESIVPNIFKMAESVQSNVITIADHGLVVGDTVKLVYGSGAVETNVSSVQDANTFQVDAEIKDESVFVYGKKVNDFLTLEYNQIFTTAIGAIQELSSENTQLKTQMASLEQRLAALESKLAA